MKGAAMVAMLQWLSIVPSFSRYHVSDNNPYSESLFMILKYRLEQPERPFESLEDGRKGVEEFVVWYNHQHRYGSIRFVTPAQRRAGKEREILSHPEEVYRQAKERNPSRLSGNTRNCNPIHRVILNPANRESRAIEEPKIV